MREKEFFQKKGLFVKEEDIYNTILVGDIESLESKFSLEKYIKAKMYEININESKMNIIRKENEESLNLSKIEIYDDKNENKENKIEKMDLQNEIKIENQIEKENKNEIKIENQMENKNEIKIENEKKRNEKFIKNKEKIDLEKENLAIEIEYFDLNETPSPKKLISDKKFQKFLKNNGSIEIINNFDVFDSFSVDAIENSIDDGISLIDSKINTSIKRKKTPSTTPKKKNKK
jgi:hypothetical protein